MDRTDRLSVGPQSQRSPAALQARTRGAETLADLRPESAAQRSLMQAVQTGPAMVAQRHSLQAAFGAAAQFKEGPVAQRAGPEDELQMKAAPGVAQLAGPEEELQMKAVAQLAGPEEELQMKVAPAQLAGPGEEELQLKAGPGVAQLAGPEDELQMKAAPGVAQLAGPEDELQMKVAPGVAQREAAKRDDSGMPADLRTGIESLSGMSMDGVKVHYNSGQPAQLNALAYAQGTDIHVGPGQEQHLPHEAWHVVQQAQGRVQADTQMAGGTPVNTDNSLEAEADSMGARALQVGSAQLRER